MNIIRTAGITVTACNAVLLSTLLSPIFSPNLAAAADKLQELGNKDFYPTPTQPVGFRGDGNGYFPGARLVKEFWEGEPKQVTVDYKTKHNRPAKAQVWKIQGSKNKNIHWKTKLPSWANSQPIVVGDKIFTTGEPDRLMCVDARTGDILWTRRNNAWLLAGLSQSQAEACHRLFDINNEAILRFSTGTGTTGKMVLGDQVQQFLDAYLPKGLPRIVAALKQADPSQDWGRIAETNVAGLKEYVKIMKAKEADGSLNMRKGLDHGKPRAMDALSKAIRDRVTRDIGKLPGKSHKVGPMFNTPWNHMVGLAYATPVSDGERVYASFGQGQTVCYDLDGKLIWATYREQERDRSRMSHAQSPMLADGVLVDMHGGRETIAGLDAKTGALLWEAPTLGDFTFGKKGGYYAANHGVMPLQNGDRIDKVLITTRCNIIRIRDGKVLGPLPFSHGSSGGPSIVCDGNIVFRSIRGDNTTSPLAAFRLALQGDTLTVEKLWETPKSVEGGYATKPAIPGYFFQTTKRSGSIWNTKTGEAYSLRTRLGGLSDLVIGKTWIWEWGKGSGDQFHSHWSFRRHIDGRALAYFHTADISDPKQPKQNKSRMVLMADADDFPNKPVAMELVPELYQLPGYGQASWGKPQHSIHTDCCMFPHGEFLIIRTVGHLYCIGPDGSTWHTPQAAPKQARTGS